MPKHHDPTRPSDLVSRTRDRVALRRALHDAVDERMHPTATQSDTSCTTPPTPQTRRRQRERSVGEVCDDA